MPINPKVPTKITKEMTYAVLPDRLPPIPVEQMTPEQRQVAEEICAGPRGELKGPMWPVLRNPAYARHLQGVGSYIRFECKLDKRINEMTALMGARAWTQQYAWNAHYPVALKAGLSPAVADAIGEGRRPQGMKEDEEIVYDFVTELLTNKGVCDPTYERMVGKFGEAGMVDIIGILGWYSTMAMFLNVARSALADGRPLPLAPVPPQIKSVTPGAVSAADYKLTETQQREFEKR